MVFRIFYDFNIEYRVFQKKNIEYRDLAVFNQNFIQLTRDMTQ